MQMDGLNSTVAENGGGGDDLEERSTGPLLAGVLFFVGGGDTLGEGTEDEVVSALDGRKGLNVVESGVVGGGVGVGTVMAGLVLGVLVVDKLNVANLPGTGYPLGFRFAQQGSIIVFVLLILVYCICMNRFDANHQRDLEKIRNHLHPNQYYSLILF